MKKNLTTYAKKQTIKRDWYLVDASGLVLGKLASRVAVYLRGKHKPIYTPHVDAGDFVVILNADKVRVTGRKATQKTYFSHSGYPGGDRLISFEKLMAKDPAKVVRHAISGMLPKTRLGRQMIKKVKIYSGGTHPHLAHKLIPLEVK